MHTDRLIFRLAILICLCVLCAPPPQSQVQAQVTQSPLPPPTGFVNDYAQVIDPATASRMETMLTNLKQRAGIEFAVVTVKTTGDQDIFDYSLAVARGWGIGSRDGEQNGVLLLVAVDDRRYQIQISRHLEGDLPDGLTGEIGRRMREPFRRGDYSAGLMTAVQTFVSTLAEKRGFSIEGIDQSYAYRGSDPASRRSRGDTSFSPCTLLIILIVAIVLLSILSRGGGGGCLNLLLLNALLNSGGGRSSGWSGGGFGGSGGGFSGFGGGGDFGGGGAGGDW